MLFIKILKGKTEYVKKQKITGLKLRGKKNATPAAIRTKSIMIVPTAWKSKVFYLNKI